MTGSLVSARRPESRVVFALDFPDLDGARAAARAVCESVGMFKVGLELFVAAGPSAVSIGAELDRPVFLDLKLHDIPETVERAVARAADLSVSMLTVHASGGPEMLRRAVDRARSATRRATKPVEIVAITVLTSLDWGDLSAIGMTDGIATQVDRLARLAWDSGVRSFVCSPHEVELLRASLGGEATLITPGVRGASDGSPDDQKRTMSAGEAVTHGADWVVVGRPIRDAEDPASAARAIAHEVRAALAVRDAKSLR